MTFELAAPAVALHDDFATARAFDADGATPWTPRAPRAGVARRGPRHALPGFRLALGSTLFWLGLVVLLPLSAAFARVVQIPWRDFVSIVTDARVMASYRLTFGAALGAAVVNAVFGTLVAWVLVRYRFPGRRLADALVDLPFALPTAVAGIALAGLFAKTGWIGAHLEPLGIQVAYTPLGVLVALTFIGLPFVVRTVQPVLETLPREIEEAAATLGASPLVTFTRVLLPALVPAILTGFTLALARGIGEYGSVIFVAGNMPMISEITPLVIITKLEQFDYRGATAVAVVMLVVSFALLLAVNALQAWVVRRRGGAA